MRHIQTLTRDATRSLTDLCENHGAAGGGLFDRVLVDAPCTGLGVLRRNPDAKWRVRPQDSLELAGIQGTILRRAAPVLRVGGRLVYSTCTLLPAENEDLVMGFLKDTPNFRLLQKAVVPELLSPVLDRDGFLRCLPHVHDSDGFFAAALERVQ